jgi:hypothetical protein
MIGKKSINLYELYAVWLSNQDVQAKYPKSRPSNVTSEMVQEYLADKKAKRGVFTEHKTVFSEKIFFKEIT